MAETGSSATKCCRNCANRIEYPQHNRYGDVKHLCIKTGYFLTGIDKDINKVKRYTPGGRELVCEYRPAEI
jgi:hypothetical protein